MRVVEISKLILWLSFAVSVRCADVSREFTGLGYLDYTIKSFEEINSEKDKLSLNFKTVQPTGLLFHGRNSGRELGDYITLELVGGRLRYSVRLGKFQSIDDTKEEFLGKDLNDGKSHSVLVNHDNITTEIWLDKGTSEQEMKKIETYFKKLELDIAIYVGGAPSFKDLQGVKSNANFMGCLTNVKFTLEEKGQTINFLVKDVAVAVGVDMSKGCPEQLYDPFTFSTKDSSFVFNVQKKDKMDGAFKFRTYMKSGTLLKQTNGNNGFTVAYSTSDVTLTVTANNIDTTAFVTFADVAVNSGNWHTVKFEISPSIVSLDVDNQKNQKPPSSAQPADFFQTKVTAGGYIGCMMDLIINGNRNKPGGLEWQGCNITDFCVFEPCLHGGTCSQDGKSFECDCTGTMYLPPVCQFSEYVATCDILKRENPSLQSQNMTLDVDGPGPLEPFKAYCNMSATPATTEIISQSQRVQITVHPPSAGKDPESIQRTIYYYPSVAAAKALARNSESCKQYIEYGCLKSKLLNVGEGRAFGRWVSSDGVYKNYWGGANPSSQMCACGEKNNCLGGKKCNCDARQNIWSSDAGMLSSERDLPVSQLVLGDLSPELGSAGNFTVGNLICTGEVSNTATFINEDGMIKLDKAWTPPSDGVISLFFKTPYAKGVLLFNGDPNDEFFQLEIVNKTSVELIFNIGHGVRRVVVSLEDNQKVNDRAWHRVVISRNLMNFGLHLDSKSAMNTLPLFSERNLDLDAADPLVVGGYPLDISKGFVGCIRGLTINGEAIDLYKKAEGKPYVNSGCGASCPTPNCLNGGRCVDDYNVYRCDCSMTPFYGYFCQQDFGATFKEDSQLTYTFKTADSIPGVDLTIGFTFASKDACYGDLLKITSRSTDQFFLLSINPTDKKLKFSFKAQGGDGFEDIALSGGLSFCNGERHTFALSRLNEQVNYTVDDGDLVSLNFPRLRIGFAEMEKIIIGSKGDRGFRGCMTGVKVTKRDFAQEYSTVQPIKDYVYDGETEDFSAVGITRDSKAKCGEEEDVGPIPTPRYVGGQDGRPGATTLPRTPSSGQRAADNQTAIIVVVVLLLVLILVVLVLVIYWYWARHKGEYHTHEDDEVLKDSSPYINLAEQKNQAGPEPEKKKEWYI